MKRNILVQSWYQGGIDMFDFTDPKHPYEIGYFTRGPMGKDGRAGGGGDWSSYYYNGYIYGSEIARGLDVFKLTPSKFLTQNEIDAATLVHVNELNVQNQQKIVWPSNLIVAKAYLDQLTRSQALSSDKIATLTSAVESAQKSHLAKKDLTKLQGMAASVKADAASAKTNADAKRLYALAEIMEKPTA